MRFRYYISNMNLPLSRSEHSGWQFLLERLDWAFRGLGLSLADSRLEDIAVRIFTAMGGERRRFHSLEHLIGFEVFDPIEQLAVLFHDVVYWSVDGAWPRGFEEALGRIASSGSIGARIADSSPLPYFREILSVFGLEAGGKIGEAGGNELFSAFAFASVLGKDLGRDAVLAVTACIEATIPFRGAEARKILHERLLALGVSRGDADRLVKRAVRMANEDLENFRKADVRAFLGGTWQLLPELNSALALSGIFSIQDYRNALLGMESFFAFLKPEFLFTQWGGEPSESCLASWNSQATGNLAVAARYLGVKLVTTAVLEALALCSGGDAPYSLFMGTITDPPDSRLESLLPDVSRDMDVDDDKVALLLESGRSTISSFDLNNSPVSAWIYRQMSPEDMGDQLARAKKMFAGSLAPEEFLKGWVRPQVSLLVRALAQHLPTRREALKACG